MKTLLISGSPRKGNTEYILKTLFDAIHGEKDLILLKDKSIKHCNGCMSCEKTKECIIDDDMQEVYKLLRESGLIIIGSPNYFTNITGLLKDFVDRTDALYKEKELKDKKLIAIVVGDLPKTEAQKVIDQVFVEFARIHKMDLIGTFAFQAAEPNDLKNNPETKEKIDKILSLIQKDLS